MNKITLKLKRIDAVKWGTIVGAIYAILSLIIIIPIWLIGSLAGGASDLNSGLGIFFGGGIMMLFMPILYAIFGFVFGWIGASILNFVLKKTGGLDMDFENSGMDISLIGKQE